MYLAFYRKYRPRTFDDVISQEHITTALKNQIKNNSSAHAYLFTGSRGTGKTTCAKIFAAAVNCLAPKDGNPCLECENCKAVLSGTATDVVEMDAASNRGVDDVRQLRDEVSYAPVSCKYRVYIIDEVHMLTPEAFNALLITLEEPPEHVKFILATTELHKVPATIVSRCQRFAFRRVDAEESAKRLLEVAEKEGAQLDEDAALLISRLSDGGMRDALSILDRCVSADSHVTSAVVRDCAGVADNSFLADFAEMIAKGDVGGCIRLLSELYKNSKDMAVVVDELSGYFRDLMLCKTAPDDVELLSCMPGEYERVKQSAEAYTLGEILRCLAILRECADGLGKTRQRKTFAEMCFVKLCTGAAAGVSERTAVKREEYRIIRPPKEEFIPTPPEKMTRESLNNLNKMREVTKEIMSLSASESEKTDSALRESGALGQAPEIVGEPPEPEEPPAEKNYGAPEVYEERGFKAEIPNAADENTADFSEELKKDEELPAKKTARAPEKITHEEWQSAVEKCGYLNRMLLDGSNAELFGNTLVVRTDKTLLLNNSGAETISELQKEISNVLGYPIILKVERNENKPAEKMSEVEKLLNKAESLGISIRKG